MWNNISSATWWNDRLVYYKPEHKDGEYSRQQLYLRSQHFCILADKLHCYIKLHPLVALLHEIRFDKNVSQVSQCKKLNRRTDKSWSQASSYSRNSVRPERSVITSHLPKWWWLTLGGRWLIPAQKCFVPRFFQRSNSSSKSLCLRKRRLGLLKNRNLPGLTIFYHSRVFHLLSGLQTAVLETLLV